MLKQLHQEGPVTDYVDKFEALRGLALTENPTLSDGYFVSNFVSGLQDRTKKMLKLLEPTDLSQAYKKAKQHESTLAPSNKKSGDCKPIPSFSPKPVSSYPKYSDLSHTASSSSKPSWSVPAVSKSFTKAPNSAPYNTGPRRITASQRDEKGLRDFVFSLMKNIPWVTLVKIHKILC